MATERQRILIVGGGIAGLATAWQLAQRSAAAVVLVEREPVLGTHSTGRNAAILRTVCADPLLSEITAAGGAFLREPPPGFADVPLLDPCGLILAADATHAPELRSWVDRSRAFAPAQEIGPARLAELVPPFAPHSDPGGATFLFPSDGRIDVAALVDGFAHGARNAGAELRTGTCVKALLRDGDRVVGVRLADDSTISADVVVMASGGWASALGHSVGSRVELRPTRRHLLVTAHDPTIDPHWPIVWQLGDDFYFRPESGGLLLCGCDQVTIDPDHCEPDPTVREQIAAKTGRFLPPHADAGAAHFWCGVRTLTTDGRFAIGFDPDVPGLFWVAGLGGHGMGSGPEIGRIAADLLNGGQDEFNGLLDPARLGRLAV